ncbi:MAG: energy transducer TonB [Bacteroidales bacterium]|nr:energy transducer TonB [Bacteroidales bacterium]
MELKKSDKANLENKKALFLQVGLIMALSLTIFAFEYKSYDQSESTMVEREAVQSVEEVVMATQEETAPPPPEDVPQAETTEFEIVDDSQTIEREFNISSFQQTSNVSATVGKIEIKEDDEEVQEETVIFTVVEQEAAFPGGIQKLNEYLATSIKYPQQAKETGTRGRVMLTFVVERDGSITDIKVLRDIGSGCGEEAKRVVKEMPKWQPAKQRGKAVRQQFVLPVTFNLQG